MTGIQTVEGLVVDSRKINVSTGVEKVVDGNMETTTMEVVMTTTKDTARTKAKEKSKRRVANPEGTTQTGEGVEMTQTHRQTMTQIGETGTQEETERATRKTKRNDRGAMMTEMTHRQTMNQRMTSFRPLDGTEDGGLHTAQNQEIPTRPARAITGRKQSAT
jgi:uncharacterized protein YaiI (UPF0178 family)